MLSENTIYCDEAEIKMMKDKIIRTLYTYIDYTSTVFVVVEPLVHLITREELVAMAKVTTDLLGNLTVQVVHS